jgi:hypothetical protein
VQAVIGGASIADAAATVAIRAAPAIPITLDDDIVMEEAAAEELLESGLLGQNNMGAPDQASDGNATGDGLGSGRERVPLSAMFDDSAEQQQAPDLAPGDNQASRHSFAGVPSRRESPDAPQASSQENEPMAGVQNR